MSEGTGSAALRWIRGSSAGSSAGSSTRRWFAASALAASAVLAGPAPGGGPSPVLAQSADPPLVTDRPDATESAVSVAPGRFQLEGGYTAARSGSLTLHSLGEALLRVGLTDRTELRLGLSSFRVGAGPGPNEAGMDDTSLGAKFVLHRSDGAGPRIAVLADATLPTGSGPFGGEGVQPGGLLAVGWDLSPRVGIGANAGYRYARDGTGRFDELRSSLALGFGLTDEAGLYLEYFADHRPANGRPSEVSLDGGVTLLLSPDLQLDARGEFGLSSAAPDYALGAGVSIRR